MSIALNKDGTIDYNRTSRVGGQPKSDYASAYFQNFVKNNWGIKSPYKDQATSLAVMGLGLSGEAGEAIEHIKKLIRDYKGEIDTYPSHKKQMLAYELGDVLHYLTRIGQEFGWSIEDLMLMNIDKLEARKKGIKVD